MPKRIPDDGSRLAMEGEYTFTDKELYEFLEVMNTPPGKPPARWPMANRNNMSGMDTNGTNNVMDFVNMPSALPLQFHPHLSPDNQLLSQHINGQLSREVGQMGAGGLAVKQEWDTRADMTAAPMMNGNMCHMNGGGLPGVPTVKGFNPVMPSGLNGMANGRGMEPEMILDSEACLGPVMGSNLVEHKEEEQPTKVSHGASEKQRRDRINSMIDQLRVLVPPKGAAQSASTVSSADQAIIEGKRSKYVVLAETIQLISVQQRQLAEKDAELARLREWKRAHEAEGGGNHHPEVSSLEQEMLKTQMLQIKSPTSSDNRDKTSGSNKMDDSEEESNFSPSNSDRKASEGSSPASGVVVDMGTSHCYIKVWMVDRRGLLSDILNALQPLPLEVKRAAITTSPDGVVTDIFDVKLDDGVSLTSEQLKGQVERSLRAMEETTLGAKRRHLVSHDCSAGPRHVAPHGQPVAV